MSYTFKTSELDKSKCKKFNFVSPGAKYIGTEIIELSKIYVPPFTNNPVRKKGKKLEHIDKLSISLMHGIDYDKRLPVVRKCNRIIDGIHYDYELVCGNHRFEAMNRNGYQEWLFDIYDFGLNGVNFEDSIRTFQLIENDHEPQLESTIEDVANVIGELIQHKSKLVENNESSIADYVDAYCKNMHFQTKGKIVRMVVSKCGAYQDVVTYTPDDLTRWIDQHTNHKVGGNFDHNRKEYGWSVKEGYEYEYIMNATRKFAETGKKSYFLCHTKSPTETEDLNDKRTKMLLKFKDLEDSLISVFEYYEKNGCFPWSVIGFLPQDRKNNEDSTSVISIK